jgi:hypothetical protein
MYLNSVSRTHNFKLDSKVDWRMNGMANILEESEVTGSELSRGRIMLE